MAKRQFWGKLRNRGSKEAYFGYHLGYWDFHWPVTGVLGRTSIWKALLEDSKFWVLGGFFGPWDHILGGDERHLGKPLFKGLHYPLKFGARLSLGKDHFRKDLTPERKVFNERLLRNPSLMDHFGKALGLLGHSGSH